jgi:predicted transposase YbfD/YdcC
MLLFLTAFESVPDPRAENVRHDLFEILLIAFVAVLCGAQHCSEMAAFGRAKIKLLKRFLKLKHGIPSHDTFSTVLRMVDPKALDAAFGRLTATLAAALAKGGVIAIDGKSLKGAYEKGEKSSPKMMVSAYAAGLRLSLATVAAKDRNEVDAALEVLSLIDLKGKIVTADALHCNRRMVSTIVEQGGDYCIALKGNQDSLLSDARACLGKADTAKKKPPAAKTEEKGHGRIETRVALVVEAKGPSITILRASRRSGASRACGRSTAGPRQTCASTRCRASSRRGSFWQPPVPIGRSRTRCIGSSTSRSARTPPATARTTARPTSRSCAAAPSTQPASTRPRDR